MASRSEITENPTAIKNEADGSFKRPSSSFRNFIEEGGKFKPEKDRYHLYVSLACPWASRTLIVRKLKGLEDIIPVTVVSPIWGPFGWTFANVIDFAGAERDPLYGVDHLKDLYLKADAEYNGRYTVPVLWDKKNHTIVNNESSEIIRMFNSAFNDLIPREKAALDFYPRHFRAEIDELNAWIYDDINNGVYKAGFATSQEVYDKAAVKVFEAFDRVEKLLDGKNYLVGDTLTEADIRLWVTAIRIDPGYGPFFKCNIRTIRGGYPNINAWMKKLYWNEPAFKYSTNFDHLKCIAYLSHPSLNPSTIVPAGPVPHVEEL